MQRRLGMLACTSDLSEEFKQELRGIRSALEQKRACNSAVDGVVSQEVNPNRYFFHVIEPPSFSGGYDLFPPVGWRMLGVC